MTVPLMSEKKNSLDQMQPVNLLLLSEFLAVLSHPLYLRISGKGSRNLFKWHHISAALLRQTNRRVCAVPNR